MSPPLDSSPLPAPYAEPHDAPAPAPCSHRRLTGEVLVATDGLPSADAAVAVAAALARRDHARMRVIGVLEESTGPGAALLHTVLPNYLERWRTDRLYARVHTQALRVLRDVGTPIALGFGHPGESVARQATADHAALVVVGLGLQTSFARLFGDETTLEIVRSARSPVLAVEVSHPTLPKRVLVAVDFTPASDAAALAALQVVEDGGIVHLCHVGADPDVFPVEPTQWRRVYEHGAASLLEGLRARLGAADPITVGTHVLTGDPATALLRFAAEHGVELIAVGTRRLGPLARLIEGSVAARLLRDARCSVLVAPAPAAGAPGGDTAGPAAAPTH